jgi:CBS domain-containing protein
MKKISTVITKKNKDDSLIEIVVPKVKRPRKKPERVVNEQGQVLNKDGSIKSTAGIQAIQKWREARKKEKEEAMKRHKEQVVEEESSEEEENEYEIEEVEIKKPEPKVIEKEVVKEIVKEVPIEKIVEKEIVKEIIKPDPKVLEENTKLKEVNKKLEDSFNFNQHLNRISLMSRQTNLRF